MKQLLTLLLTAAIFYACDCPQQAKGIVLDKATHLPIQNVSIYKTEKIEDSSYAYNRYTNERGAFIYHSISGGACNCPDLILYFTKEGYKTEKVRFKSMSVDNTVYLERSIQQ